MGFAGLNYSAVLAAAVASFLFGGLWYGALSKQWLAAIGKTLDDIKAPDGQPVWMAYAVTFACQLVMAWVLAGVIGHLGPGQVTVRNGIISGAFVWLGFVLTSTVVNHTFQGHKRALTLIDAGHWLGVLAIQGAVIGLFGV